MNVSEEKNEIHILACMDLIVTEREQPCLKQTLQFIVRIESPPAKAKGWNLEQIIWVKIAENLNYMTPITFLSSLHWSE